MFTRVHISCTNVNAFVYRGIAEFVHRRALFVHGRSQRCTFVHGVEDEVLRMKGKLKEEFISFRVDEDEYEQIAAAAEKRGESPNEWCRSLALSVSDRNLGMTPGEWECFRQLAIVRHLSGMILRRNMSVEEFTNAKKEIDEFGEDWAEALLRESWIR